MDSLFNPSCHISILPVNENSKRPLWSVVIPTYNCADFLKQTLKSVLAQDLGPKQMEIIVVDDHSIRDNPKAVVEQYGQGRVQFFKQKTNVGKSRNYATGINKSQGQYIHLLHGDDTVSQGFYKELSKLFTSYPEISAAFCRCNYVNAENQKIGESALLKTEAGVIDNFLEHIAVWQLIQPPSIVFKREVYETLGAYDLRLKYIEDWEFYVRVALKYRYAYTPKVLAQYRIFPQNSSSQSAKRGQRIKTLKQVLQITEAYLPPELALRIKDKRHAATANYMLGFIPKAVQQKDVKGALLYSLAFFQYNRRFRLIGRWLRFILQYRKFTS